MKLLIQLFIIIILINSCNKNKNINPENYITLEYKEYKHNNRTRNIITPKIKDTNDNIGIFMNKHNRRFEYFLKTQINRKKLKELYPNTLKINEFLKKEVNNKNFNSNFTKLIQPNKVSKEEYSMREIMNIASKFFYIKKTSKDNFGVKICIGQNGINELNQKNTVLIEAIVFEAIFGVVLQEESIKKPKFISNSVDYLNDLLNEKRKINIDSLEIEIRNEVYNLMENDKSLKKYLKEYLKINNKNIPFNVNGK